MKAIDPTTPVVDVPATRVGRHRLVPRAADLVDAGFLACLCVAALAGFAGSFQSGRFLVVAGVGVVIGIVVAFVVSALRWSWLVGMAAAAAVYLGAGGCASTPTPPTLEKALSLAEMAIFGWKGLLTTLPPVRADSPYLALVGLAGMVASVIGFCVARATTSPTLALVTPVVLVAAVILLGTDPAPLALPRGLAITVFAVGWAVARAHRRHRLTGTGSLRASSLVWGALLTAIVVAAGVAVGPMLPGTAGVDRMVLRTYVRPPIDVSDYPSPLPGFVKFASPTLQQYYDIELFDTTGLPAGAQVRIAVLDQYDGLGWSATGTSGTGAGFRKADAALSAQGPGQPVAMSVTMSSEYAQLPELNPWVPALGPSTTIAFEGADAAAHQDGLGYDAGKGQVVVTDLLRSGDTVSLTSTAVPQVAADAQPVPAGVVVVPDAASDFAAARIASLAGQGSPWSQLMNVGKAFTQGFWSDGTAADQLQYLPGDGQGRMAFFFSGTQFVGSDEQYATAFALAANRLGFPARVVFGARVESNGQVLGKDIAVWVEIDTTQGWQGVPTSLYIPSRTRTPQQTPPNRQTSDQPLVVPPPRPDKPVDLVQQPVAQVTNVASTQSVRVVDHLGQAPWVVAAGYGGAGIAAVVLVLVLLWGAKAVRSQRRRTRGDPVAQVQGGWQDILDRCRDLGRAWGGRSSTRSEVAAVIGLPALAPLAGLADQAMFGQTAPDAQFAAAYWEQVRAARTALGAGSGPLRRLRVAVNPRSLLPRRDVAVVDVPVMAPVASGPVDVPGPSADEDATVRRSDLPGAGRRMA